MKLFVFALRVTTHTRMGRLRERRMSARVTHVLGRVWDPPGGVEVERGRKSVSGGSLRNKCDDRNHISTKLWLLSLENTITTHPPNYALLVSWKIILTVVYISIKMNCVRMSIQEIITRCIELYHWQLYVNILVAMNTVYDKDIQESVYRYYTYRCLFYNIY